MCMYVLNMYCMYVCMYVCMYICMYVHMYACMYVCMYVCNMYVCMYVCMYVHTHICCIFCICGFSEGIMCSTHTNSKGNSVTAAPCKNTHIQTCTKTNRQTSQLVNEQISILNWEDHSRKHICKGYLLFWGGGGGGGIFVYFVMYHLPASDSVASLALPEYRVQPYVMLIIPLQASPQRTWTIWPL